MNQCWGDVAEGVNVPAYADVAMKKGLLCGGPSSQGWGADK